MNLTKILPLVTRPVRYINHEWNVVPPPEDLNKRLRLCFCFPDLYELGASNLGLSILYHIVNLRTDAYAERVYAPEKDFAQILRKCKIPLFSLETRTPLKHFHLLGFSLQYELGYTNVLNILDLAGIPLKSSQREEIFPLLIAGGPCVTANPEPVADFFDLFVLGEGEEVINEIVNLITDCKLQITNKDKKTLLRKLAKIPGVYVPSFYEIKYNSDKTISAIQPKEKVSDKITPRKVNLENASYPTRPIVPYLETVHERLNIEIMRGCPWACRFCQAGFIYRPYREKSKEKILSLIEQSLSATGYEEIALTGLSVSDYREIEDLIKNLIQRYGDQHLKLSLPSLRCDRFSVELMKHLEEFPQTTLTFAPEAGSETLREVLKKKISDEEIFATLGSAYTNGWRKIKLYFMYGLPKERDEDLKAIASLAKKIRKVYPGIMLTFTISPFVPKTQTPFQWCKQEKIENLKEKKEYLLRSLPGEVRAHSPEMSFLESIFARGDRRLSEVILLAWKKGCLFDQWKERLNFTLWQEAFVESGIAPEFYLRERKINEILPWELLNSSVPKEYLEKEYRASMETEYQSLITNYQLPITSYQLSISPVKPKPKISPRVVQKVRLHFSRENDLRFLSQLEEINFFRRLFRRANLPSVYTQGFQPLMKVSFGPAISVGYSSKSEYVDLEFFSRMDSETIYKRVVSQLPKGMDLLSVKIIATFFPSLESVVNLAEYEISLPRTFRRNGMADAEKVSCYSPLTQRKVRGLPENLKEKKAEQTIAQFLEEKKFEIYDQRKKKTIDVYPLIRELKVIDGKIKLFLRFYPQRTVKPELIIGKIFNLSLEQSKQLEICRVALYQEKPDGELVSI